MRTKPIWRHLLADKLNILGKIYPFYEVLLVLVDCIQLKQPEVLAGAGYRQEA